MDTPSSHSSPEEGYAKALDLLQQLQSTIETQQKDIAKLHARIKLLKEQNEELRKERDELRKTNAENTSHIAELTRRNSIKSLPIQRYLSTPGTDQEKNRLLEDPVYIEPPLVRVEEPPVSPTEVVPLRKSNSRTTSKSDRIGIYVPTPPTPRRPRRERNKEEREEEEEEEERVKEIEEEEREKEIEEDNQEEEEEEEEEMSITPIPAAVLHHLIDSNRPGSSLSTDLSSNDDEGSITSIDDFRSPTPSSLGSSIQAMSPTQDPFYRIRHSIGSVDYNRMSMGSEEDDFLNSVPQRSRLATIAYTVPKPARRRGEKEETDSGCGKTTPLRRQNSFPRRGRQTLPHDQNYLSPDMEMKIQELIQQALGRKYGGIERATSAATVLQRAYRKRKIDAHYNMLRQMQQNSIRQRRRTMSVRHSRKPSIMKHKKNNVTSASKMDEVRDKFKNVTQTSLSPAISKRELRTKLSPFSISKEDITLPNVPEIVSPEEEEEEDDERSSLARSPSIFSGVSVNSLNDLFPETTKIPHQLSRSALNRKTNIGTNIFNRKPIKGIQYLVYHGIIKDDPLQVAKFMKSQYGLSKEKIGEFVGEIRYDFNMAVLECLVQLIDLSDKPIDEAIRSFQLLFRMPGEAQKIDKVMQVFAGEYYNSNSENGVIRSEDAAYVLSFAIMMLHTDLHNPSVKRHMTRKDWIRMNRGTNDNEDYPEDFLLQIYDRIQQTEFATGKDHTDEVNEIRKQITGNGCPPLRNAQRRFIGQFNVLQVNDMHKRVLRRHRRVLLLFNDVLLVVKGVAANKFEYRKFFTLLHSQAMEFHTNYYKFGVVLQHEMSGETYHCNCENEESRRDLLSKLDDAIFELKEMEKERITEGYKNKDGEKKEGDLLGTRSLSSSADDLHALSMGGGTEQQDTAATGVGCGVELRRTPDPTETNITDSIKRSSKDSGFDSPVTTSPSPNGIEAPPTITNGMLSPKKEQSTPPRSRTPEPRRTMRVIPDSSSTANKYLTLSPKQRRTHHDKTNDRKSMPPTDAMSRLREHSPLSPKHSSHN